MTILTKTTSGTKLNPKGIDPAAVETGAIIDQVSFLLVFFFGTHNFH